MRLILKPNINSKHVVKNKTPSASKGDIHYDTVDICDAEGTVWASVHVDLFHVRDATPKGGDIYDGLFRHGRETIVEVSWESEL